MSELNVLRNMTTSMADDNKPGAMVQPTQVPKLEQPKFGFNDYAERLNGRAAMVGFVLALVIEYVTGKCVLEWLGLR